MAGLQQKALTSEGVEKHLVDFGLEVEAASQGAEKASAGRNPSSAASLRMDSVRSLESKDTFSTPSLNLEREREEFHQFLQVSNDGCGSAQ